MAHSTPPIPHPHSIPITLMTAPPANFPLPLLPFWYALETATVVGAVTGSPLAQALDFLVTGFTPLARRHWVWLLVKAVTLSRANAAASVLEQYLAGKAKERDDAAKAQTETTAQAQVRRAKDERAISAWFIELAFTGEQDDHWLQKEKTIAQGMETERLEREGKFIGHEHELALIREAHRAAAAHAQAEAHRIVAAEAVAAAQAEAHRVAAAQAEAHRVAAAHAQAEAEAQHHAAAAHAEAQRIAAAQAPGQHGSLEIGAAINVRRGQLALGIERHKPGKKSKKLGIRVKLF